LFDRVVDLNEDDRDRTCGRLKGHRLLAADANDDGRRQRHQLASQGGESVGLPHRIAHLDPNGLAIDVAEFFEPSAKRAKYCRFNARGGAHQKPDARNSRRLLRDGNRPGERRAAKRRKKAPPFHWSALRAGRNIAASMAD